MYEVTKSPCEKIPYRYFSGISMTDASDCPTVFPEHWHMSAEFLLARRDGCHFKVKGMDYFPDEGDLLLIWPAQLHQTVSAPAESHLILQFSSELLTSCDDFSVCYPELQRLHLIGSQSTAARSWLKDKILGCLDLYTRQEPFSETKMRLTIYEILLYLCETQLRGGQLQPSASEKNYETYIRIQDACNYIRKNCQEDLSQKDVAKLAGFSQYYFSRVFKEYTQESFTEYLTRQRIQNAITLLCQDDLSVTDVAFLSGFQSLSNFSKVFRNAMQCSPIQYRRKLMSPPGVTGEPAEA